MSLVVVALPIKLPIMPRVRANPPRLAPLCTSQLMLVNYACGTVQLVPSPFLSSNTPDVGNENGNGTESSQGDGNGTENRIGEGENRHRSRHKLRHRHEEMTPEQSYCCRWMQIVERDCVCGILAHLPLFLSWHLHHYTIFVGKVCMVTFTCGG
ncbi:zinc transporter 7-B [Gossypium australe]|uniref:Zinc transporter 7-B n=1 Tax=Gossypium australe TaxID=47621 RepID=A0A5B6VPQ6_9ROSI|nr:zinc transporter 7-B [Gossypium australe]